MPTLAEFLAAVHAGDAARARALLAAGPLEPPRPAPDAESPLLAALFRGQGEVVDALLAHGYEPDLAESAALGDAPRIEALVSAGAAPEAAWSADGWTPLHLAAFLGRADAVRVLLAHGAPLDAVSRNATANHPLHAAIAGRGDAAVIAQLLAAGADPAAPAGAGWTPLHLAASRGAADLVDRLLALGVSPAPRADDGRTPAEIARERGHAALAERLERLAEG